MKKIILVLSAALLVFAIMFQQNSITSAKINDKLIRFHVIANSDSDSDQSVKLKVRDAILNCIGDQLSKSGSVQESFKIIQRNEDQIENTANKILKKEGKNYTARVMLGEYEFPVKNYGDITLPAGKYTALRVVLGNGDGKNWWCVMFPPLCFIDITKGLSSEETNKQLQKVMNDREINAITAFKQQPDKLITASKGQEPDMLEKTAAASSQAAMSDKEPAKEPDYKTTGISSELVQSSNTQVEFRFKSIDMLKEIKNRILKFLSR